MSNEVFNHNPNQSSVDWLIGEIMKHQITFYGTSAMPLRIIEQAKAMHKEEVVEAVKYGFNKEYFTPNFRYQQELFEQYYNETFGQ